MPEQAVDPLLAKYGATPAGAQPQQPQSGAVDPLLAKYGATPVVAKPETPWYDKQAIHPETWFDDAKDADGHTWTGGARHVIHGALAAAGGLTSLKSGLSTAALVGANFIPYVGPVADAYAVLNGVGGIGTAAINAYHKVMAGDWAGAEETGGEALPGAIGTAYGVQRGIQRYSALKSPAVQVPDTYSVLGPEPSPPPPTKIGSGIATPVTATVKLAGKGANALAHGGAESALNIRPEDRAYGADPGQAILDDTHGITPKSVKKSGVDKQKELGSTVGQAAGQHEAQGGTVSLTSALNRLKSFRDTAKLENDQPLVNEIDQMTQTLTTDADGMYIPSDVGAPQALSLLKGFRRQFASYRPDAPASTDANLAAKVTSHDLTSAINAAMPTIESSRDRISSLYPVVRRAEITDRGAPIEQKFFDKLKANTGVLAGGFGTGAAAGYLHGGPVGGLLGGLSGLTLPILLSHPNVQLTGARLLNLTGKGLNSAAPYVGDAAGKTTVATPFWRRTIVPPDPDDEY
jgi:hypothetical protein